MRGCCIGRVTLQRPRTHSVRAWSSARTEKAREEVGPGLLIRDASTAAPRPRSDGHHEAAHAAGLITTAKSELTLAGHWEPPVGADGSRPRERPVFRPSRAKGASAAGPGHRARAKSPQGPCGAAAEGRSSRGGRGCPLEDNPWSGGRPEGGFSRGEPRRGDERRALCPCWPATRGGRGAEAGHAVDRPGLLRWRHQHEHGDAVAAQCGRVFAAKERAQARALHRRPLRPRCAARTARPSASRACLAAKEGRVTAARAKRALARAPPSESRRERCSSRPRSLMQRPRRLRVFNETRRALLLRKLRRRHGS